MSNVYRSLHTHASDVRTAAQTARLFPLDAEVSVDTMLSIHCHCIGTCTPYNGPGTKRRCVLAIAVRAAQREPRSVYPGRSRPTIRGPTLSPAPIIWDGFVTMSNQYPWAFVSGEPTCLRSPFYCEWMHPVVVHN